MTVKIVRLKSGEDIISDVKEVYLKENEEKIAALQFEDPFSVALEQDAASMFSEGTPIKVSNPKVHMISWIPLSSSRTVYIEPTEVVCAYDPHAAVLEQYQRILEAINGRGDDLGGGAVDESLSFENSFVEASGSVSDWEGD